MVRRAVGLLAIGVATGVVVDRVAIEVGTTGLQRWLARNLMNKRVNPWLLAHGYPGSKHAEIGTLEHIGRTTGALHLTPVHPTIRGDVVFVPAPLGEGSQWARNVLRAGHARLRIHEEAIDLDAPALITITESGLFPAAIAAPFDRLGLRYVRFHVSERVPGAGGTLEPVMAGDGPEGTQVVLDAATKLEPAGAG